MVVEIGSNLNIIFAPEVNALASTQALAVDNDQFDDLRGGAFGLAEIKILIWKYFFCVRHQAYWCLEDAPEILKDTFQHSDDQKSEVWLHGSSLGYRRSCCSAIVLG